jgi:hypothetical protein
MVTPGKPATVKVYDLGSGDGPHTLFAPTAGGRVGDLTPVRNRSDLRY